MHEQPHHSFEVESEQPDNRNLFIYGVAIAFVFFSSGITLTSLFYRAAQEIQAQRSMTPSPELQELRAKEDQLLTTYGWVDRQKQVVRIPIDQAMKLIVEGGK